MNSNPAPLDPLTYQSPTRSGKQGLDESNMSHNTSAVRQFLNIVSPNRANQSQGMNSSLLSALFPGGNQSRMERSQSPYRDRVGSSQFHNEQEYKEQTSQILAEQGYNEDEVKAIQSNMLLYKSISAVKEYREYMKDKMRRARDFEHIKPKVSTVNKNYKKRSAHSKSSSSFRKDFKLQESVISPQRNLQKSSVDFSKVNLSSNNTRSQKILEIENILLQNSQPYQYTNKHTRQPDMSSLKYSQTQDQSTHQQQQQQMMMTSIGDQSIGEYTRTPHELMKDLQESPNIHSIGKKPELLQPQPNIEDEETQTQIYQHRPLEQPSPPKHIPMDEALTVEDLEPISPPKPSQQREKPEPPSSSANKQQFIVKKKAGTQQQAFAQPKFTVPTKQSEPQPEQLVKQASETSSKSKPSTNQYKRQTEKPVAAASPKKQQSARATPSSQKSQSSQKQQLSKKPSTPIKKSATKKSTAAEIMSPPHNGRSNQKAQPMTTKNEDKLQLNMEDNYLENGKSEMRTTFQSPDSIQKQSFNMGSSGTSFFKSPNTRTMTNYKAGNSNLAFKNDAISDDLNNREEVEYSNIDDTIPQSQIYVEKTVDTKQFIENYTINYQRKKDDEVQALLNEFRNSKKLDEEGNIQEHPDKWLKRGDSPTKRLIQMKKAAHIHQPSVKDIRRNSTSSAGEYSIRYVASPAKSYVVKPVDGEIDYSDAYRNFDKFYDRVSKQEIVKYRIAEDQERKNENKDNKWFKTPNEVKVKQRPRFAHYKEEQQVQM